MFISVCPRGRPAREGAPHEGLLPWFVDAVLVLSGFETAGDFVELMSGGVGAAAADATVDAAASLACDLLVALALTLGVDDAPLGGHGAQVLALLAKLGAPCWATLLACLLSGPVVLCWEWSAGRRAVTSFSRGLKNHASPARRNDQTFPGISVGDTGGAPPGECLPPVPPLATTNAAHAKSMNSSAQ
jgi:hypothetical protein